MEGGREGGRERFHITAVAETETKNFTTMKSCAISVKTPDYSPWFSAKICNF